MSGECHLDAAADAAEAHFPLLLQRRFLPLRVHFYYLATLTRAQVVFIPKENLLHYRPLGGTEGAASLPLCGRAACLVLASDVANLA